MRKIALLDGSSFYQTLVVTKNPPLREGAAVMLVGLAQAALGFYEAYFFLGRMTTLRASPSPVLSVITPGWSANVR